jgi:hypothetical protein
MAIVARCSECWHASTLPVRGIPQWRQSTLWEAEQTLVLNRDATWTPFGFDLPGQLPAAVEARTIAWRYELLARRRVRARLSRAHTTSRPGSAGSSSIAGRYQRRDDPRARGDADARSSGTANARRRHGSDQHRASERTLAAQLETPSAAAAPACSAHDQPTPHEGVGDPSATRLQLRVRAYVGAHPERWR